MSSARRYVIGALAVVATAQVALSLAQAADAKKHHHHAATKSTKHTAAKAQPATEQPAGTQSLGRAGVWSAYVSNDKTGRVCYVVGQPQKSEPAGFARRAPSALVTYRPTEQISNVVSFVEGYTLKDGSDVALDVGGSKFDLFTKEDSAWARTSDIDKTIVGTLSKAQQAVVKGTPQKGPPTTDIYTLAGFGKALALIDKACGVKR